MTSSQNHTLGVFFLLSEILEMDAIQTITQLVDYLNRIHTRANVVPQIGAKPDTFIVASHCLEPIQRAIIKSAWPMIVNGYANIVLSHQSIETFKGIRLRIGRNIPNTRFFCEFKEGLIGLMIT